MHYNDISYSLDHGIARITLNKPEKMNALSWGSWAELENAIAAADAPCGEDRDGALPGYKHHAQTSATACSRRCWRSSATTWASAARGRIRQWPRPAPVRPGAAFVGAANGPEVAP